MEEIISYQFTWTNLILIAASFLAFYFLLTFAGRLLETASVTSNWQYQAKKTISTLIVIYEPLTILVLVSVFIFINPLFNGLIVGLLFFTGFSHIRNYMSGRVVHMDKAITPGKKLRTGNTQGLVSRLGSLGLDIQTNEGLHHITYSQLLSQGYTLFSGEEIGGFYHLRIIPEKEESRAHPAYFLTDMLATAPYLDWDHKPEYLPAEEDSTAVEVRVVLKEESFLHELRQLIREWGYSCTIVTTS